MRSALVITLSLAIAACTGVEQAPPPVSQPSNEALPDFDNMWNMGDLRGTEARFLQLLPRARTEGEAEYLVQLMTQIARVQGLQQKYSEAHFNLDEAEKLVTPEMKVARTRLMLERGRVLNSSGKSAESVPYFKEALEVGRAAALDFYAVDAAHMLGIATTGRESLEWNDEAIRLAEAAKDPKARLWLGALYNNTGWTHFDMGQYEEALKSFEKDLEFRKERGDNVTIGNARWSVAKMHRHLGRVEESLRLQQELLQDPDRQNNASEGYGREEIAECLLQLGRAAEATPYFARAWELLRNDPWLAKNETARLERLKELGKL